MPKDWSREEVEITVAAYFEMLAKEQAGIPFNKAEMRRKILPLLNSRSQSAIEFKNQNISAVLAAIGQPYISGYLPASNYQALLAEVVFDQLRTKPQIEESFQLFASTPPKHSRLIFDTMVEDRPTRKLNAEEPKIQYRTPVKVNYIAVEQANRDVGLWGEKVALDYERWRLVKAGKAGLADKIEWVSQTQGDGLGFDILSRNDNGTDRYIEVKATKLTKQAPFYFSALEYDFSKRNKTNFFLYRVFNLHADPRLFIANGAYDDFCNIGPTHYKGSF